MFLKLLTRRPSGGTSGCVSPTSGSVGGLQIASATRNIAQMRELVSMCATRKDTCVFASVIRCLRTTAHMIWCDNRPLEDILTKSTRGLGDCRLHQVGYVYRMRNIFPKSHFTGRWRKENCSNPNHHFKYVVERYLKGLSPHL